MSLKGFTPKTVQVPRGAWSSIAFRRSGTPSRASWMQNMRIRFGTARSRPGTSPALAVTGKITSIVNWITPWSANLVLYLENLTLKAYNQGTAATQTLATMPAGTRAPSVAQYNVWAYFSGYDTAGNGTAQVSIFDGQNVDQAFPAPPTLTACTAVDGGPGQCTQGQHFLGFVYQDRTGYSGAPATTVNGVAISVTLNAGLRQINISVSLPAMANGGSSANGGIQATLFLIATRADNPAAWYFMPSDAQTGQIGEQPVPYNQPTTLNFVMSFSDEDIAAELNSALPNFQFLHQTNGAGPFTPSFVTVYGTRMVYGDGTNIWISDQDNPQQLAGDLNLVRMANQRKVAFAFQLPQSTYLYLVGDKWTASVNDNNDSPSTWTQPVSVSDALGAPFPECVCAVTGGNYVWIVTETGPYLFDGEYENIPLTYLVSGLGEDGKPLGWNRVNWPAAYAIQIKDDVTAFKLYVAVPLDGATECNFMFCIDYRMGRTFDSVDISLDNFNPAIFSSIAIVKEAAGNANLWIGPAAAGSIARFDHTTHNDQGAAINNYWTSGLVRGSEVQSSMVRVGYLDLWIRGNAPLKDGASDLILAVTALDGQATYNPTLQIDMGEPAALIPQSGVRYSAKLDASKLFDFVVTIGTNAVDEWVEISSFTAYLRPDLTNR